MCIVSAVGDHYRQTPPWEQPWNPHKRWPEIEPLIPTTPPKEATPQDIEDLTKAFKKAFEIDQEEGQENCVDPEKYAFIDEMIEMFERKILDITVERLDSSDDATIEEYAEAIRNLKSIKKLL